jgi:hypothetical protein
MVSLPAFAQNVAPADVKLDDQPAAAPAPAPAANAAAPAAAAAAPAAPAANANANASVSLGANANAGASAPANLPPPPDERKKGAATERSSASVGGPVTDDDNTWKMGYSGYFRAPMRLGIGTRDNPLPGQSKTTLHTPLIPDDQYLSWQHTNHARRDWAEMFFSYGNSWAKGVLAVEGYNFTDANSYQNSTQFGIGNGWLEVTPPLPWENTRIKVKAGSFWNRYGQAGRWDAGEYDTYLFGRTHAMGETVRLEFDMQDQPMTIGLEHGIGVHRPDSSVYNTSRYTLVHHIHADMLWDQSIFVGLHFLHNWTQEEARYTGYQPSWISQNEAKLPYQSINQPDGKMWITGAEVRFDMPDLFGYLYLGGSFINAKNAVTVGPATEVIHSFGGGDYNMGITGNYLDSEFCRWRLSSVCSNGNGNVLTLLGQYEAKLGDLLGASPFGDGQDLTMKFYGMWNKVKSDDPVANGITKLKVGTDFFFDAFPVLAFATRFDYLAPNSRYANQNFMILSPRIVFRSQLVTHEQITIQYSRYMYKQRECASGTPADIQDTKGRSSVRTSTSGGTTYPAVPGLLDGAYLNSGETAPIDQSTGLAVPVAFPNATPAELQCVQPPPSTVTPDGWGAMTESQEPRLRGMPYTGSHLRPDINVITIEASMWW